LFVVEDGTGLEDANSYASYADWTAYWADRGGAPAGVQAVVEAALVNGADYLGIRYRWKGVRLTLEQALEWPRAYVYRESFAGCAPIEGVPVEVVQANIELAKRALSGELAPDPTVDATGQVVTSKRDKVGPIETERVFSGASSATFVKPFPQVDRIVRKLVEPEGGRVFRA
jgi:DnaT-like ssDNA binding protein